MTQVISIGIPFLAFVCYGFLIILVLRHDPRSRLNQTFTLYLLSMAIWSFGSFMMHADFPIQTPLFWNKFMTFGLLAAPVLFFQFVRLFLKTKTYQGWLYIGLLSYSLLTVANIGGYIIKDAQVEHGVLRYEMGLAIPFVMLHGYLFSGLSIYKLMQQYRQSRDMSYRNRIMYPLVGMTLVALGTLTNLTPLGKYPLDIAFNTINAGLITYAILRYQLLDIIVVVRKGLLYSVPTAIIGAGYFFIIFLVTRLFHAFAGPQILLISLLVAVITAVVAQPLRDRAQLWVDRLFFREKYDSSLMLQRLSSAAASVLDLDRLTGMILDEVTTTMHIERAAFFLKQDESGELRLMAQRGLDQNADLRLRKDQPIVDWLSSHEYVLTRHGVDVMPQLKALWVKEREDLKRMGAELFIPLKAKGELVGIFAVGPKLSGETYSQDDQLILTTLANQTAVAIENARLYQGTRRELVKRMGAEEELRQSYVKLRSALEGTIHALISAVEMRDPYTAGHQLRVTQLACAIAKEMGLPEEQIEGIHMAGLVHDIGKINVPAEILSKPGTLNDLEFGLIKTHSQVGHNILDGTIEFPWPIAQIVLQHHERMDGSGYPVGLSGDEIILEARILGVADVVEAMASHRPYRPARGIDQALVEISQNRGILYDPEVVDACLKLFNEKRFKFE
jgi:GAF domain-containing protein